MRPVLPGWRTVLAELGSEPVMADFVEPETRYARSGDVHIAYQVLGEGPFDIVYVPPSASHIELAWRVPAIAAENRRLASFSRLIRFDKRGTGMSDPVQGAPGLETRMDDVRVVMDAVGSERAALIGVSEGGPMSILFAATYPERVWSLVLMGTYARDRWAPDYPCGVSDEDFGRESQEDERRWGTVEYAAEIAEALAPSANPEDKRALATMIRHSATPGAVAALNRLNREIDVRQVLDAIHVPTLIVNRRGDHQSVVGGSRYLAEHVPGARHVEFAGKDHAMVFGDAEPVLAEIEQFLTEAWDDHPADSGDPDRVLATVLFTDIVGSTSHAVELGDARWRQLLERHHALTRRLLRRYHGRELDVAGDGFFATFDGPARAIRCALDIAGSVEGLGIEVRAGLHTGECEVVDGKIGGIAVHIGARVAAAAQPGEVLVSCTVRDLVAGSGITFEHRGTPALKGIPREWHLYAALPEDAQVS
jgi:class 3 adenylate cyclase